ncbi:MAG: hypothetical protein ABGW78_15105, partial [Pirellulales bacterium]
VEVRIDGQSEALRPGFTAEAEVMVADLENVVAVPVATVLEQDGEYFCAVREKENGVSRRVVVVGLTDDNYVQIVGGLKPGENIFMNPRQVLGDQPIITENTKNAKSVKNEKSVGDRKAKRPRQ